MWIVRLQMSICADCLLIVCVDQQCAAPLLLWCSWFSYPFQLPLLSMLLWQTVKFPVMDIRPYDSVPLLGFALFQGFSRNVSLPLVHPFTWAQDYVINLLAQLPVKPLLELAAMHDVPLGHDAWTLSTIVCVLRSHVCIPHCSDILTRLKCDTDLHFMAKTGQLPPCDIHLPFKPESSPSVSVSLLQALSICTNGYSQRFAVLWETSNVSEEGGLSDIPIC